MLPPILVSDVPKIVPVHAVATMREKCRYLGVVGPATACDLISIAIVAVASRILHSEWLVC